MPGNAIGPRSAENPDEAGYTMPEFEKRCAAFAQTILSAPSARVGGFVARSGTVLRLKTESRLLKKKEFRELKRMFTARLICGELPS